MYAFSTFLAKIIEKEIMNFTVSGAIEGVIGQKGRAGINTVQYLHVKISNNLHLKINNYLEVLTYDAQYVETSILYRALYPMTDNLTQASLRLYLQK